MGWKAEKWSGIFGESMHEVIGESALNFGLGKYLSLSIAPDFSEIDFNIGLGLALPLSHTVPVKGVDFTFGDYLYDYLHGTLPNSDCENSLNETLNVFILIIKNGG